MFYRFARSVLRVFFALFYRLEAHGRENIPQTGAVVLCSNHISLFDPPLLGTPLKRKVHYMAKAELFRVPILGAMITNFGAFPVTRGGVSKDAIRGALGILKEGHVLGIFPEGSRKNKSGVGKKGAAMLALKSNATVIPVAIVGQYRLFRKMKVYYGKPVDLSEFAEATSEMQEAATEKIMAAIYAMLEKRH